VAETKEGVVQAVTEKFGGALQMDGEWLSFSNVNFRDEPWTEPKKGMTVRVVLNPWEKDDGTTKMYVKSIEDISPFEEVETVDAMGNVTTYSQHKEPFRSPAQIMRGDALRCATDTVIATAKGDVGTDGFAAAVVALAAYYLQFIESGMSE